MVVITFACGHRASIPESATTAPTCPACGHATIARVKARAPRFVGVATGPYCETKALDPMVVNLAPKGALPLKEPTDG